MKRTFRVKIWPVPCLNDSELKYHENYPKLHTPAPSPPSPLEACAFGAWLGIGHHLSQIGSCFY